MKHRYLGRARGACGQRALFLLVDVSFLSGKRFLWEPRWLPLVMSLIPKFEDANFLKSPSTHLKKITHPHPSLNAHRTTDPCGKRGGW